MGQVKSKDHSEWRDGFLFVGNHLALDFLNTRPAPNGEPTELLPDIAALLRWFQAAELLSAREAANLQQKWGNSSQAQRAPEAIRGLREKLRKEVLAWGSNLACLKTCLRRWHIARRCCSPILTTGASASVASASCISMTPAKRGPGTGAACNCAGTA